MNITSTEINNIFFSFILLVIFFSVKTIFYKGIGSFGKRNSFSFERILRTKRFVTFFIGIIIFSLLLLVWGVNLKEFFLITATTFTIIGTACFASWSNLSNISSGIILFFSYQIKLGDRIKVGVGDGVVIGTIWDMKLFYVEIKTDEKETILYPNNMLLHQSVTVLKNKRKNRNIEAKSDEISD